MIWSPTLLIHENMTFKMIPSEMAGWWMSFVLCDVLDIGVVKCFSIIMHMCCNN
jgi:hypothetical protein